MEDLDGAPLNPPPPPNMVRGKPHQCPFFSGSVGSQLATFPIYADVRSPIRYNVVVHHFVLPGRVWIAWLELCRLLALF